MQCSHSTSERSHTLYLPDLLEPNTSLLFIDTVDFYFHGITDFRDFVHVRDSLRETEFRYVDHPFFSFSDLHDRADCIENLDDLTFIDIADLYILDNILDEFDGFLSGFLGFCRDGTLSIIREVDFDGEVFLDPLNRLTSFPDHFTHLLFWDLDCEEEWCIGRELFTRLRETFFHFREDIFSC